MKQRDILLDSIPWRGNERVLDVGCGPGLLAIGAAKRAPSGSAIGIDIWDTSLETRNSPQSMLQNATLEGVDGRVEVKDGNARNLPFPDSSFDVVLARAVLHHIKSENERATAIREMVRVLKPRGHIGLVLIDFNRLGKYLEELSRNQVSAVRILRPKINPKMKRVFGTVILVASREG